jgi:hypothetical protein
MTPFQTLEVAFESHSKALGGGLFPLPVSLLPVMLQNGPSGHFLGPLAVPARLLRTFLNVFVFPLLFVANTAKMFARWHLPLLGKRFRNSPSIPVCSVSHQKTERHPKALVSRSELSCRSCANFTGLTRMDE